MSCRLEQPGLIPTLNDYVNASDEELVDRSARGDRRAFDELFIRRKQYALRVAFRFVRDASIAQDVVQEAFVRCWSQTQHFNPHRARFTTWLYRIVLNLCIDQKRRGLLATQYGQFNLVDPSGNAEEIIEIDERDTVLASALNDLPARQRAAVTLIYDEGLSAREAAQELGVSAKAVERLLYRARLHLRSRLRSA